MTQSPLPNETDEIIDDDRNAATDVEAPATPVQPQTSTIQRPKEDPLDFDHSDVSITILLHQHDGDARGRLVSVLIHNFSGPPQAQDFREADLSTRARLDNLQQAIALVMQRFLLNLTERAQQQQKAQAKQMARTATAPTAPRATPAVAFASTASPSPATLPAPPVPSAPPPAMTVSQPGTPSGQEQKQQAAKKPEGKRPATTHQPYSLF